MPISKNKIKEINSLKIKKYRQQLGLFTCEGTKTIHCLLNSNYKINEIYATKLFFEKNEIIFNTKKINLISEAELQKISSLSTPPQVLAIVQMPNKDLNYVNFANKITLVLDNIQDPGNLGTIIRLADWFGVENIVCSQNTVDAYNPKVVQATMGSLFAVNVFYTNLKDFFQKNKEIQVFGTFIDGQPINKTKISKQLFLLLGNEANGISDELSNFISKKITIPTYNTQKMAESLNVANATAICLWELFR